MTTPATESSSSQRGIGRTAQVIIVSSVMFSFISYWRTAAVVLCDLASTAYYIGGIVESSIGKAAPFFILAVMVFSYAVRNLYMESCALFVRGGVYRVVKSALGSFMGKLAVSALLFDFILTGPTSGVAAGQYLMGLAFQFIKVTSLGLYNNMGLNNDDWRKALTNWGAVVLASLVTIYFFRQNIRGLHESSDKALKIMLATTVMAVIMLLWCVITLIYNASTGGFVNDLTWKPDLEKKTEYETETGKNPVTGEEAEIWIKDSATGKLKPKLEDGQPMAKDSEAMKRLGIKSQEDPLGFLDRILPAGWVAALRNPRSWLSLIGVIGLFIAFGHSVLAMSGEETLAQVYREVESPKMPNFKKAALIVFIYSLVLTAGISFLAVALIPDQVRMKEYQDNLIGGLARHVLGPPQVKLMLEAFVVIVGFLILSGAVNTAIIGSNGVLNRVAEDGVLPDWFLKPHPRYGTTYRMLYLIGGLQLFIIVLSGGDTVVLGEAYAFGVVWSFVFMALAMVVLRFTDKTPREYKVPFNVTIRGIEIPVGLIVVFLILALCAFLNFFTKEVATIGGIAFTALFLVLFTVSERYHAHKLQAQGLKHEHMEQFNKAIMPEISPQGLGLTKSYRKLVSIRSTQNLFMLEKALKETDPETTGIVVMTAKAMPRGTGMFEEPDLDSYDQQLMTAVVDRAEKAGKQVKPLIVPTNNPLHAILQTAKDLQAHELVMGGSNKYTADEQLEQIAFYWISLHHGNPAPLTVRILTRERDMYLDLAGGNRIPKISERKARTVAELRAAGVGVDKVLLAHDGSPASSDLFQAVLTMLDPEVQLDLLPTVPPGSEPLNGHSVLHQDQERAEQLGRTLTLHELKLGDGSEVVRLAHDNQYDLVILPLTSDSSSDPLGKLDEWAKFIVRNAHCRVLLASTPGIPQEVVDKRQS